MRLKDIQKAQNLQSELTSIEGEISNVQQAALLLTQNSDCISTFTIQVFQKDSIKPKPLGRLAVLGISFQQEVVMNELNGEGWKNEKETSVKVKEVSLQASDTDVYQMLDVAKAILESRRMVIKAQLQQLGVTL